ncbi:RidA family protein [Lysinimonas soli]|uniref:RidA family protein n=1 Tax=Lysinimonas soli TaxID=1074233 RepID=A0ABW0NQ13_9MICO
MTDTTPRHWNPEGISDPIGKYSHLTLVPPGSALLFIAGQVGTGPDGEIADDSYQQTLTTFHNIESLLDAAGLRPVHLVRLLSFVAGAAALTGYYAARDEVYARWFGSREYPGHSLAVVAALAKPQLFVEIEGWAAVPPS